MLVATSTISKISKMLLPIELGARKLFSADNVTLIIEPMEIVTEWVLMNVLEEHSDHNKKVADENIDSTEKTYLLQAPSPTLYEIITSNCTVM